MSFILHPRHLFFSILSSWVNRQQREIIEFQNAQIRALMDKMGRRRILRANGIEPAPIRKQTTTWKTFLQAHWDSIAAVDFTTIEVWTKDGLTTLYILVAMRLNTRRVEIAGVTANPAGDWVGQMARNLTASGGFLNVASHLLIDRDTKFASLEPHWCHQMQLASL